MERAIRTSLFSCLALSLLVSAGCAGRGAVRDLPVATGIAAEYRASADQVAGEAPAALDEIGYGSIEHAQDSTGASVLLASKGMNLWSWGEALRVRVEPGSPQTSIVRVAGMPNYALDYSGRAGRHALKVIRSLDQSMGPEALAVRPKDRVRGRTATGDVLEGTVIEGEVESTVLWDGLGSESTPTIETSHVFRGAWDQSGMGLAIGGSVGLIVAMGMALSECPIVSFGGATCEPSKRGLVAIPVGALVGWALGKALRTEIWSPVVLPPGR